jgi:hypothetical protein
MAFNKAIDVFIGFLSKNLEIPTMTPCISTKKWPAISGKIWPTQAIFHQSKTKIFTKNLRDQPSKLATLSH